MNTKQVIAAAAIALVGSAAFAQSEVELQHFGAAQASSISRAEVRADVQRAQAQGELNTPSEVLASAVSSAKAPALFARSSREFVKATADLATPTEVAMFANKARQSTLSRGEVRAEAREYVRSDALRARISTGY